METLTPSELKIVLETFGTQLSDIVSFLVGGIVGVAFVITANFRWL